MKKLTPKQIAEKIIELRKKYDDLSSLSHVCDEIRAYNELADFTANHAHTLAKLYVSAVYNKE